MKTLYFDCFSGAAGDMLLGALFDAGADERFIRQQLDGLNLDGWSLELRTTTRGGIRASQANVVVADDQPARTYSNIRQILRGAQLDARVREIAERVFEALARAESLVHGVELTDVHLHEVAALDAFVDIVGSAAALVSLDPAKIVCSPLPVGGGTTKSAHGRLPVPPPAVAELVRGVVIRGGGERELLTPTGAAILATVATRFGELPTMRLERVGYGAGVAERDIPNVVRVLIGEEVDEQPARRALLLEANIDDMSPELVPPTIERLLAAGAFDAWATPILMKKGRPAITLSALVPEHESERVLDVFYAETTTFGVRSHAVDKHELEREWIEVEVEGNPVRVKLGKRGDAIVTRAPEYEDASRVARATGLALKEVYRLALLAAEERVRD